MRLLEAMRVAMIVVANKQAFSVIMRSAYRTFSVQNDFSFIYVLGRYRDNIADGKGRFVVELFANGERKWVNLWLDRKVR